MRENAERGSTAPRGFESRLNLIFFPGYLFTTLAHKCDAIQISFVVRTVAKKTHQPFSYETCFNGDHYFVIVACEQSGCSLCLPI